MTMSKLIKRLTVLQTELEQLDSDIKKLEYQWKVYWPESKVLS